jgi:DNA-binding LacI/PurR family transcriptional regulator
MWKAVRVLKQEGILRARRGSGIRVVGVASAEGTGRVGGDHADAPATWGRLAEVLEQDIVEGNFRAGTSLPPYKQLAAQYGVCYRTLRKALSAVAHKGYLLPHRRRFSVTVLSSAQSTSTVVLIAPGKADWQSQMTQEYMRALERECSAASIGHTVIECPGEDPDSAHRVLTRLRSIGGSTLGVILRPESLPRPLVDGLLMGLSRLRLPVAWLDETGSHAPPLVPSRLTTLRVFSMPRNIFLSEKMARYLKSLGHRRVAYISPLHWTQWSQDRLAALETVFRSTTTGTGVEAVLSETAGDTALPVSSSFSDEINAVLRRRFGDLTRRTGMADHMALRKLQTHAWSLSRLAALRVVMQPLLRRASSLKGVTAWVCANDDTALSTLDFLDQRGVRVPDEVSVVGFDDVFDALGRGLTTYNFDRAGAMRAMVSYFLGPSWQNQRRAAFTYVQGYVVERGTAGRAQTRPRSGRI